MGTYSKHSRYGEEGSKDNICEVNICSFPSDW